mgnify:FL=1|jgi:nitrate reductase NapAB chaperone NapD|tara:strand:+ start:2873 stop:3196 length:324 start_codon:yes stop_codon:yes gene_type:complete
MPKTVVGSFVKERNSTRYHKGGIYVFFQLSGLPQAGCQKALLNDLTTLDHCEVMVAKNEEILILVTDTADEQKEKELQKKLNKLKSLQSLGMTFGHTDEQTKDRQKE